MNLNLLGLLPALLLTTVSGASFLLGEATAESTLEGSIETTSVVFTSDLIARKEAEWKEREASLIKGSPEWYAFMAEKYTVQAEWGRPPSCRDFYLNQAAQYRQEAEWKTIEAGLPTGASPEWYAFMAETHRVRAEWDPTQRENHLREAESYLNHATQLRKEAAWKEREANLVNGSPELHVLEWYVFMAEKSTLQAEWDLTQREYHLREAESYLNHATQLRKEAEWKEREASLIKGSPEWYAFMAEKYTVQAEWTTPSYRNFYLKEAACHEVELRIIELELARKQPVDENYEALIEDAEHKLHEAQEKLEEYESALADGMEIAE